MFLGQHDARVEAKNRIAFPAKMREESGKRLIVTYGFEESLIIIPFSGWEKFTQDISSGSFLSSEVRDIETFLFGGATDVALDAQGRFVLPGYLKEFAKIRKNVVFVGVNTYIRLWDKEIWDQYRALKDLTVSESARILGERLSQHKREEEQRR